MEIEGIELGKIIWSAPLSLKKWCLIFDIDYKTSRNKLAQWFKDQTIRNKQMSPRYWRVHIEDLPAEYVARVMFAEALENSKGEQSESE